MTLQASGMRLLVWLFLRTVLSPGTHGHKNGGSRRDGFSLLTYARDNAVAIKEAEEAAYYLRQAGLIHFTPTGPGQTLRASDPRIYLTQDGERFLGRIEAELIRRGGPAPVSPF